MKIMILTDLEGCSGTEGTKKEGSPGNSVFTSSNMIKSLTDEINACADGLFAAGADEILVWDTHGGGRNFSADALRKGVVMSMSQDAFGTVCHLDASFDAAIQIGCHSRQGKIDGYLNHTRMSSCVQEITLNGIPVGEAELAIYRASFFNIPHILVTGEYHAVRDALEFNGKPLETVVCKRGFSRYSVLHRPPNEVCSEIRTKSERALRNLKNFNVKKMAEPVVMTLRMMCPNQIERYVLQGFEQLDATTIRMTGSDAMDLHAQMCGWVPKKHNSFFNITEKTNNLFPLQS